MFIQTGKVRKHLKTINCWDFKQCRYGPAGHGRSNGVCPAVTAEIFDGKNHGKNGGRYCWKVPDTLCACKKYFSLPAKLSWCINCDFFKYVKKEENHCFEI